MHNFFNRLGIVHNLVQSIVTCLLWIKSQVFMLTYEVWSRLFKMRHKICYCNFVMGRMLRFNKAKKQPPHSRVLLNGAFIEPKFTLALWSARLRSRQTAAMDILWVTWQRFWIKSNTWLRYFSPTDMVAPRIIVHFICEIVYLQ